MGSGFLYFLEGLFSFIIFNLSDKISGASEAQLERAPLSNGKAVGSNPAGRSGYYYCQIYLRYLHLGTLEKLAGII